MEGNSSFISDPTMFFLPIYHEKLTDRISLWRGDMFFCDVQTLTGSVNTKGVMGKGLASRAKYQFADAFLQYQDDCKSVKLKIGQPTFV